MDCQHIFEFKDFSLLLYPIILVIPNPRGGLSAYVFSTSIGSKKYTN